MRQSVKATENESTDDYNRGVVRFGRKGDYSAMGHTNDLLMESPARNGFHLRVRAVRKNKNYDVCTSYLSNDPDSPCKGYSVHPCRV